MTFIQPFLLWALPLVFLPVLIHLLNRLRFRPLKWAAMMFLVSVTRSSTRRARLRHYLILLCRALVVLLLILALSRPLIGGWLGIRIAGAPNTVVVLLDRSASMEAVNPRSRAAKREHALTLLSRAAKDAFAASRFVLIENVFNTPHEIEEPAALASLALVSPTDTAANIPAMLASALDYIAQSRPGRAEIWIASDFQSSNWLPASREWVTLNARLAALSQDVKIRIMALSEDYGKNASVALRDVRMSGNRADNDLVLAFDIERGAGLPDTLPMIVTLGGVRQQVDLSIPAQSLRFCRRFKLPDGGPGSGWGRTEIPADTNPRDNVCYFAYGEGPLRRTTVVSDSEEAAGYLGLAAAPAPDTLSSRSEVISPADASGMNWSELSLLIWQAELPGAGLMAKAIHSFVEEGGVTVFFPSGKFGVSTNVSDVVPFGFRWADIDTAPGSDRHRVILWEENEGPLARTDNGMNLALPDLEIFKRQAIERAEDAKHEESTGGSESGSWRALANFEDGRPFLMRRPIGKGRIFICASLPSRDWSNLAEGSVLVPMIQRMLKTGAARVERVGTADCGEWTPSDESEAWTCVDGVDSKNFRLQAGVYGHEDKLVALNRPDAEDLPETIDAETAVALLEDANVRIVEKLEGVGEDSLHSEIWRALICLALVSMIAEAGLLLSERSAGGGRAKAAFDQQPENRMEPVP